MVTISRAVRKPSGADRMRYRGDRRKLSPTPRWRQRRAHDMAVRRKKHHGRHRAQSRADAGESRSEIASLPAALAVDETEACFIVRDANRQALAYGYFEDEPAGAWRRSSSRAMKRGARRQHRQTSCPSTRQRAAVDYRRRTRHGSFGCPRCSYRCRPRALDSLVSARRVSLTSHRRRGSVPRAHRLQDNR
jgi:hypothetical protein